MPLMVRLPNSPRKSSFHYLVIFFSCAFCLFFCVYYRCVSGLAHFFAPSCRFFRLWIVPLKLPFPFWLHIVDFPSSGLIYQISFASPPNIFPFYGQPFSFFPVDVQYVS